MITENKRYVLKKIIKFFENKEFHYKNLYRDAIKQYKFLTNSTNVSSLLPNPIKKDRDYQIKLVDYCHELCSIFEKEGINYYLAYGNLLGAYRNGSFIPWDDDFDIELLREDFNKLKKYCEENFIEIPIIESSYNDYHRFQILDKYIKKYPNKVLYLLNPDCIKLVKGSSIEDSLQLDCLVLDYYRNDCNLKQHWNYLANLKNRINKLATDKEVLDTFNIEIANNENVLKKEKSSNIYYGIDSWSSYDRYRANAFFDEKDYLPAQKIIFEGKEFLAPNNPERILRLNYGNIEQFPENLDLHRHLDKQQNSAELLKQVEKKQYSDEKKFVIKHIKNLFSKKTEMYQQKFRKKYGEVKFLKQVIDIKTMKCGNAELRKHQLSEFEFCKEMIAKIEKINLPYFLVGGTLIGALRHRGYVPWDDDFDIGMMRKDYTQMQKFAKDNFIEIPPLKSLDRIYQFEQMNEYLEKYPNQIIFLQGCHWLRFIRGTNLLDVNYFEVFAHDYFAEDYPMEEHKKYLQDIKLKAEKTKNYKEKIELYSSEMDNNPNFVDFSSKIYYGLDSIGSYIINPTEFMTQNMIFPLKRLKFEDTEFSVPNDSKAYIEIQYKNFMNFPNHFEVAPTVNEKINMYKKIKGIK